MILYQFLDLPSIPAIDLFILLDKVFCVYIFFDKYVQHT